MSSNSNSVPVGGSLEEVSMGDGNDIEVQIINSRSQFENLTSNTNIMEAFYSRPNEAQPLQKRSSEDSGPPPLEGNALEPKDAPRGKPGSVTWAAGWGKGKRGPPPPDGASPSGWSMNNPPTSSVDRPASAMLSSSVPATASEMDDLSTRMAEQLLDDEDSPSTSRRSSGVADTWEDAETGVMVEELQNKIEQVRKRESDVASVSTPHTTPIDYLSPLPDSASKTLNLNNYEHVLEVYGFTSNLSTSDLHQLLKKHGCHEYSVKWVDDTHAIVVFSNAPAAMNVIQTGSTKSMKFRRLADASKSCQEMANQSRDFLQPYVPRPQTTVALARRLVESHLGRRSGASDAQRQREKEMLTEARQKKKADQQLRKDVWEGKV